MSNNFLMRHQDQMVGGLFRVGAVIQRSAAGVIYETEFGEDARPAAIKIRFADNPGAQRLVSQWRNAIGLTHPNLLQVYAAGFSELDDAPVVYVVMERAEASLAGVVQERPLSEGEMREILAPVLSALSYLHENGYAYTGLKPSNILAVGDHVRLSGDNALRLEDGGDPADDIRALGTVIVQGLTQEFTAEARIVADSSQSFSDGIKDVVRHCLDPDPKKRWNPDQIQKRLEGRVDEPVAEPVPQIHEIPAAVEDNNPPSPSQSPPVWVFIALAALVAIVLLAGHWGRQTPPVSRAPVAAAAIPAPAVSWPAPEVIQKPSPVTGVVREGRRGQGWSVVVATYGSREAADKRRYELALRWPKFTFGIFQQQTEKAQYLIVVGQNLSEDEAEALRKRAVASGVPADTYIKKFP